MKEGQKKTKQLVEERTALLSVHDVSPVFEDDIIETCDRLQDIGLSSFTLLVTPFYELRRSNRLDSHELFSGYLSSLGQEVSLHGYAHRTKTGRLDEFKRMPHERVVSRIKSGVSVVEAALGIQPYGFIPPMWIAPKRIVQDVESLGLHFCVIKNRVYSLEKGWRFETVERLVSQGRNAVDIGGVSLELELGGSFQLGIHPLDHKNKRLLDLIVEMKDNLGYTFIGYRDYIESIV